MAKLEHDGRQDRCPALGDKMAAMQADRQQHDEPPRDPEGTLYKPGESGRIHGEGRSAA